MKATSIPGHEASFRTHARDTAGKQFVLSPIVEPVPGETEPLQLTELKRDNGDDSFYFHNAIEKHKIALHFTAGYLKGDVAALTQPGNHVSVAFLVARGGEIYRLWDPSLWSYHLGPGAAGGNTAMSSTTIGIEISNIGPLIPQSERLVTTYGNTDVYCDVSQKSYYRHFPAAYRGHTHFAAFSDAQYASVARLLRYLTTVFQIPRIFVDAPDRFEAFDASTALAFRGIASQVNFRATGKWDIGPAFDWDRLVADVTA